MNNRKFLMKVKRSLHSTMFGDRVTIIVRTPWENKEFETYWEKCSGYWEDKLYYFYWYKTKPHYAKQLLKELHKKFDTKTGVKFLSN